MQSYRRSLQKNPAYYKAFCESMKVYRGCGLHTQLYLQVFAPVMTAYVEWVLAEAAASGKKRLYFLARDGFPMYLAAERLVRERKMDIECRYLKISRYALRIPIYHKLGRACLDWICLDGMEVTFDTLMKRAQLTADEAEVVADGTGFLQRRGEALTRRELFRLKEKLGDMPYFLDCVYAHSKDAYADAVGYLRQEGLLEDVTYALVDSGWTGTIQKTLKLLLQEEKPQIELEGYYFGLYELPAGERTGYHAFYFTPRSGLRRKVRFSNCLFESVFSEGEGMTMGYAKSGSRFVPVTGGKVNPNRERLLQNAAALQCYVGAYCKADAVPGKAGAMSCQADAVPCKAGAMSCQADVVPGKDGAMSGGDGVLPCGDGVMSGGDGALPCGDGASLTEELLSRFMGNPVRTEAECYGTYLFSDDVLEERLSGIAAPLSEDELRQQNFLRRMAAKLGIRKEKTAERGWIEGSIAAGGRRVQRSLRQVRCYKYFVYIRKTWKDLFR